MSLRSRVGAAKTYFANWLKKAMGSNVIASTGESASSMMDRFIPISSTPQFLSSLTRARNDWNPSDGAMNNFHNLMENGLTGEGRMGGGRQQFRIQRDPNPAALALALLDYRLANELSMTPSQRARRFVIVINGIDNGGQQREIARSIDPGNVNQVLALVSSIAGGQANRSSSDSDSPQMILGSTSEAFLDSDPEAYQFAFMTNITSVTLRSVNPVESVDDEGNVVYESPSSSSGYSGGSADPSLPRRSSRIARLAASGSSGGAFFRYWLSETFPESLSFLQVYKRSESKKLVKDLSAKGSWTGGDSFELSCLANSIILQELPSEKFMTLFEFTCANKSPVFPSSRMGALANALQINICLSTYSPTHMTCGGHQRSYIGAHDSVSKTYYVGKVGDHFIPDFESDWTRFAIRNYKKFKELGGRAYCDLPLYRVKQMKGVKVSDRAPFISFITRGTTKFATYGEILSILLWGYEDPQDGYQQPPFVETMTVEDICLRSELYMYFQSMMKFYDLPTQSLSPLQLSAFVGRNARTIDKYIPSAISFRPSSADRKRWGKYTCYAGNRTEFHMFREQYEKEGGAKPMKQWMFPDRHSCKTSYVEKPGDGSLLFTPYTVLLPFTIVAFDTETFCIPASRAAKVISSFNNLCQDETNEDFVDDGDKSSPVSPSNVETVYNSEGVCEWEHSQMVEDDEYLEGEPNDEVEEALVHIPYCASVCFYVDIETGFPVNFRLYDVDAFGVDAETDRFQLLRKTFCGFDCVIQLNVFLGSSLFNDVSIHLIAHNARYDVNMMMRYSFAVIEDGIFRSTGRMNVCDISIQAFPNDSLDDLMANPIPSRISLPEEPRYLPKGLKRRSNVWEHKRKICVQCSLACTGIPLSAFGSTFNMDIAKEYMPYEVYTLGSLYATVPTRGTPAYPNYASTLRIEDVWGLTSAPSKEIFEDSVWKAGALLRRKGGDSRMNLWKYARYYCEMDCEVLLVGYLSLRREMFNLKILSSSTPSVIDEVSSPCCQLLMENAVSLPQFASHYFGLNGVFDGICEYKGALMSFIRRGVCGGKTMLQGNSPVIYNMKQETKGPVADQDSVNLYGTAMKKIATELGGFPQGFPTIWAPPPGVVVTSIPDFILHSHYYMVLISITKLGRPLRFPIVNGPREIFPSKIDDFCKGWDRGNEEFDSAEVLFEKLTRSANSSSRHFTNHPEGARMVVDKITYEDIIEFHHGADIEVHQALYWDEGGNDNIGAVMEYLFADRVKKQQEGKKAAAQARKLTMNSGYGRLLMAAPDSNYHFVEGKDNIHRYIARHSCTTKEASFIRPDFAVVERRKGVQDFYNASPLGAMVLSMSKRIMNRVMVLYEDLFEEKRLGDKFCMFYQDTDSIHLAQDHVDPLFRAYTKKYGQKILVKPGEEETDFTISKKELGAFCSDFESVPGYTPPASEVFVGVMKKVYVDCMSCKPLKDEGDIGRKETYHARMKGIPKKCVDSVAEHGGITLYEMYKTIFIGYPITFDLAKYSVRFEMGKDFSVSTNTSFKRVVQINWESIMLSHIEWVKSGWSFESFPYYASFLKLEDGASMQHTWVYASLLRSVDWDAVKKMGLKCFPPKPPSPPSPSSTFSLPPPLPPPSESFGDLSISEIQAIAQAVANQPPWSFGGYTSCPFSDDYDRPVHFSNGVPVSPSAQCPEIPDNYFDTMPRLEDAPLREEESHSFELLPDHIVDVSSIDSPSFEYDSPISP